MDHSTSGSRLPTYRAIPSSELDDACQSNVHEAGVDGNGSGDWTPSGTRTKWTYFLLGCAILIPWSALVNGTSFFMFRLADSPLYPTFTSFMSSTYTFSQLVCQFYCTITSKQSSPSRRIFASIIAMILLVTSLCLSTFIRGTSSSFFAFVLFSSASVAAAAGYLCTAVYAGAAILGPSYLQTVFLGQGTIAVLASAVQVASSMVSLGGLSLNSVSMEMTTPGGRDDQAEEIAARIFFGVSAIFLGVTLVAYTWLTTQFSFKSITDALEQRHETGDLDELAGLVLHDRRDAPMEANSRVYHVFKHNFIFMFSITYVFTITLALFPAITARVHSVNPGFHPLLFIAVHCLVFSIGDLTGQYGCSSPRLVVWSAKKILAMSLLRTLFIPLILLCNIHRRATASPVSATIHSDVLFMVILLGLGFTNGFVSTGATLAVSSLERNPRLKGRSEDVDVAATLGGFCGIVGLVIGALASFGVQAMI